MKKSGTNIAFLTLLLICMLCLCLVFSACDNGIVSDTSDTTQGITPDSSADADTTVSPESSGEDSDTESVTEETTEEATEEETTSEPRSVTVTVYGADGSKKDYSVEIGATLSAAALEAAYIPESSEELRVEHIGWEYSIAEDGERSVYNESQPPIAGDEGLHIYPVINYSFLVRFDAGEGSFADGVKTSFFVKAEESFRISELLTSLPSKTSDESYDYLLEGFESADGTVTSDKSISVSKPTVFTARYEKREIVYSVRVITEHGKLIGGGREQTFRGNYSDARKFVESYENYTPEAEFVGDVRFDFIGLSKKLEGREWTIELLWDTVETRFDFILDYNNGEVERSKIFSGETLTLPVPEPLEDEVRYYHFVGWRDSNGQLYNGGYQYTVTGDVSFVAEYVDGDKKIYSVTFETEVGEFENGSPVWVLTGYYGDPIVPPQLIDQVFGAVVYSFAGWNKELIPTFTENAEYTAVFTTPYPVYTLNYYIPKYQFLFLHILHQIKFPVYDLFRSFPDLKLLQL